MPTMFLLTLLFLVQSSDASHASLLARDKALVEAFLKGDPASIKDLYSEAAIVMPPNASAIRGHDAILPWAKEIGAVLVKFSASPIDVRIEGNLGWIAGSYSMTVKVPGGKTADDRGKYLEVWQLEGGRWRIVADMFNSDLPAR